MENIRKNSAVTDIPTQDEGRIRAAYEMALHQYSRLGIDVARAMNRVDEIPLSIHCWQGDDGTGFENPDAVLGGGLLATGNHPGKARTPDELRQDLEAALAMIPGPSKVNLHAIYLDHPEGFVDRDAIEPRHYESWVRWAKGLGIGLDFNSTFYAHPKSRSGFTLSNRDAAVREFWIEHGKRCRRIGDYFGQETGMPCVTNLWIPDGEKECPIDKTSPRERLADALDRIFSEKTDPRFQIDAVESKLFGLGSESYVTGSHEFYMGYTMSRGNSLLTLDTGHFHPTEKVSDKLSSLMLHVPKGLLIHVSRPVRWDSDHVVLFDDELRAIMHELVRIDRWDRTHLALDYFDASIHRVTAWVVGARNARKALLEALLEPLDLLLSLEDTNENGNRMALAEELKTLPFGAVWDFYCLERGIPVGTDWIARATAYEKDCLARRIG